MTETLSLFKNRSRMLNEINKIDENYTEISAMSFSFGIETFQL